MSKQKWILVWLLASLACVCAEASLLESKNPKRFNALTQGTAYGSTNPQPDTQFSGVNATSSGVIEPAVTAQLRLTKGRMGYTFAGTVPRYYLGEEILPPETLHSASTETLADGFWRAKPVRPGEIFSNPDGTPLIDTDGSPLPNLTPGDSAGAPLPALANGEYESFYYSKHADAVFASRPGTVEIWWVSASPQGSNGGAWQFRRESFTVSGAASAPVRKIYWTEKSFDGPRVSIPTGRIERVNPVYTANFPIQVSKEYQPPGFVQNPDPNAQMPSEKRTLWFENQAGNAQLAAYNLEGRLLVEYLGPEISPGRHE
ncbi:MAG: hypothetical protein CNE95_05725, partial [Puniceicoccaceae bacterium MED-G30]